MVKTLQLDLNEIRSVTDFQRNAKEHISRLRKSKAPMVLTTNGSASVVVQDAKAYQALVDRVDELEEDRRFVTSIYEGLADVEAGRTRPAREAFEDLRRKLGIPG